MALFCFAVTVASSDSTNFVIVQANTLDDARGHVFDACDRSAGVDVQLMDLEDVLYEQYEGVAVLSTDFCT